MSNPGMVGHIQRGNYPMPPTQFVPSYSVIPKPNAANYYAKGAWAGHVCSGKLKTI